MNPTVGRVVLGLSACGYPLCRTVQRRGGRGGASIVEVVCVGLALRDGVLVSQGAPGRLRRLPRVLLYAELVVAAVAAVALAPTVVRVQPADARPSDQPVDTVGRNALAALFALHTIRFGIYLRPDQGRRLPGASGRPAGRSAR